MPKEYYACVESELKSGKNEADANRICSIWFNQKFGITPSEAHKIGTAGKWDEWKQSHGFLERGSGLELIFLGTGSLLDIPREGCDCPQCKEAKANGKSKRKSPGVLVRRGKTILAVDAGPDFVGELKEKGIKPDAILLTHSHMDHIGGLKDDDFIRGVPVYATKESCRGIEEQGIVLKDAKVESWPRNEAKKFDIGEISVESFPVAHSVKAPSVAFKFDDRLVYAPDFLGTKHWNKFNGVGLAVMDGSSLSRDIVHSTEGSKVVGHKSMKNSGKKVLESGAEKVVFTHVGHVFHNHESLKRKIHSYFGDRATVAYDGMILEVPESGSVELAEKAQSGIYLVPPHGEMVWRGEKTAVVKSKPLKTHLFEPLFLASGDLVYGIVELSGGEPIGLKQFDELREKHRVTEKERLEWWPDAKELFLFNIKMTDRFEHPKPFKHEQGIQTFIKEVKFEESVENIQDAVTYDAGKVSNAVLSDDFRLVFAWWSTLSEGKEFKYSKEQVRDLAIKIGKEIVRRAEVGKMKHEFEPDKMAAHSKELFNSIRREIGIKMKVTLGDLFGDLRSRIQVVDATEGASQAARAELPVEKSVDVAVLTNTELKLLHERVHDWYHHQIPKGWSLEDLVNLHQRLIQEMEKRELKHTWHGDGLDKAFRALPVARAEEPKVKSSMILGDLERNLPKEIVIDNFVRCIGSVAEGREQTADCDILFQYDGRCFALENLIADRLGDYKIHVVADSRGAHGMNIPLYDLKLVRKEKFEAVEPYYSLDERPILPSKPKKNYLSMEKMREANGDQELSVEPFVLGERLIAFAEPDKCAFYDKHGNEVGGLDELGAKVSQLTNRNIILDGFLQSDASFTIIEPLKWSTTSLDFLPLDNRQFFLSKLKKTDGINILPNFWTDNVQQFDEAMQKFYEGGEVGVVLKHRQSEYTIEGENPGWLEVFFEQATSEGEQKIEVGKPFNLMKAVSGYREEEYFKIDDLYKYWARGYLDEGKKIIVQPKFDGFRMAIHRKGDQVWIYTEDRKRDRAPFLPDVVADVKALPIKEFIMDSEFVWWAGGQPMSRQDMIAIIVGKTPIKGEDIRANIFDLLWLDGKNLTGLPYIERLKILDRELPNPTKHLKPADSIVASNHEELEVACKKAWEYPGSEGAMLKVEDMGYDITGRRTMKMAKFKRVKELAVEVIGKRLKEPPKGAQAPSKTFLYRVAVKGPDGKLFPIDAEGKITPKVISTDQNRDPKYRWAMKEGWERKPGDYDYGRTYASNIDAKIGEIITVQPVLVNKWPDKEGKTRYSWIFPAVREQLPDKKEPDGVDVLERFIKAKAKEMKGQEEVDCGKWLEETRHEAALKLLRQMGNPYLVEADYKKKYEFVTQHHIRGIPPDWNKEQINQAIYSTGRVLRAEQYENEIFRVIAFNLEGGWFDLQDKKTGRIERLSMHTDFRMECGTDYLIGMTIATPASNFKPDKFNDNHPGDRSVAIRKSIQPLAWLKVSGHVKPGEVGATKNEAAYFEVISRGQVIYGTAKDDFYEYRLEPDFMREGYHKDRLAGRWVFSLIPARQEYERVGDAKFWWQCWKPEKEQDWYAKTHDYEKELEKAKKDGISFIWQAPGVEMKRYDPPGLKRASIEKREEEH